MSTKDKNIGSYWEVISSSWVNGSLALTYDPRDPSKNGNPFDPWPTDPFPSLVDSWHETGQLGPTYRKLPITDGFSKDLGLWLPTFTPDLSDLLSSSTGRKINDNLYSSLTGNNNKNTTTTRKHGTITYRKLLITRSFNKDYGTTASRVLRSTPYWVPLTGKEIYNIEIIHRSSVLQNETLPLQTKTSTKTWTHSKRQCTVLVQYCYYNGAYNLHSQQAHGVNRK